MKTKITLITLLFLTSFYGFTQNYDIENIRAAVLSPHNGEAYFFVGKDKVYQYKPATQKKVAIRNLGSDAFKGIPKDIDAALVHPTTKKVFVFRGNNWYRYNMRDGKRERTGVIGSDGFKGITGPFDGAVAHGTSGNYAFFKGSEVFIYNPKTEKVQYSGRIGANNVYKGVPFNIDAVVQWNNGKLYFFKGDHYYRYDPKKLKIDAPRRVTGRDGFKKLFPSIDAALINRAFIKDYYWEQYDDNRGSPETPALSVYDILKSSAKKTTPYGYKHYEGVPKKLDAALFGSKKTMPYFLKGTKYYRYDPKTRKTKPGDIKTLWKGIPTLVDAAYSDNSSHHFFKDERWYAYDYKGKFLRPVSGAAIKNVFKGVPNYLDAAIFSDDKIYFYKKNTEYVYDRGKRKVIAWNSITKITK